MNCAATHSSVIPATPTRGVVARNPWARNLLTFLMVFGRGLIVMEADNDAGAVSTYVQAGAQYGTHLLWLDPAQMASDLSKVFGPWFRTGILLLMINAATLGTTAISLSSAWAYGEVRGWPHSLQKSIKDAPGFYGFYVLCVAAAAGVVLIPKAPLQLIILSVQVLAGIMLPSAIIFLQLLLNDKEMLGDQFANKPWNNIVNWTIIIVLFALSLVLAVQVVAPRLFPAWPACSARSEAALGARSAGQDSAKGEGT
jgi:Mn2+/Fe2+ NRAMP family transporter